MQLKKLSASSLNSADLCLARWKAERDAGYGASIKSEYARLGSSVHGALQDFVQMFHIDKKGEPIYEFLIAFYKKHFMKEFSTTDLSGRWYDDGVDLLTKWFHRTDFSYFEVVSVESKQYFDVRTSIGMIPVTYIIDRFDRLDAHVYRVVDYKTSQEMLNTDLLAKKIQAKMYGLATQIEYPDAEEVWVEFDMLRSNPVQICLSKEDNAQTYRQLQRAAERIIEVDEEKPLDELEQLNPFCGWCMRKSTCSAVQKNISVGGLFTYTTLAEMLDARALLDFQRKAASDAVKELDTRILAEMEKMEEIAFSTQIVDAELKMSKTRVLDTDLAASIVGEEKFRQFGGGPAMSLENFDKMVKALGGSIAKQLESQAISYKYGDPRVTVKPKSEFIK